MPKIVPASKRPIARSPLALGMTQWGPLPGTTDALIVWHGVNLGLFLHVHGTMTAIKHCSANGIYRTVEEAETAVFAFVAAIGDEE
jgi:hypothetical protein